MHYLPAMSEVCVTLSPRGVGEINSEGHAPFRIFNSHTPGAAAHGVYIVRLHCTFHQQSAASSKIQHLFKPATQARALVGADTSYF